MNSEKEGEMFEAIAMIGGVIFQLGLEVYRAYKAGDTTKTVGEIFAGVKRDTEKLDELEAQAAEHFRKAAIGEP